jgi:hypothetical protein
MKDTKLWDRRYQELKEYKRHQGDTNVPRRYEPNPQLGVWVSNQRQYYKKYKTGISGWGMTDSRIKRLENIGFEWVLTGGRNSNNDSASKYAASLLEWESMYDKLVSFKRIYGHTNVPRVYERDQNLADWVNLQKHGFKRYQCGMKSKEGMTLDRFHLLLEIGFQYTADTAHDDDVEDNHEIINEIKAQSLNDSVGKEGDDGEGPDTRSISLKTGMREGLSSTANMKGSEFQSTSQEHQYDSRIMNGIRQYNEEESNKDDDIYFEAIAASGDQATLDSIAEIVLQKFSKKSRH